METIAALFGALAGGLRRMVDLAFLAFGLPVSEMPLTDAIASSGSAEKSFKVLEDASRSPFELSADKSLEVSDCTSVTY